MKLTDEELISAIEAQEASSLDAWSGVLSGDRAEALARYRGEPDGTEIEGRSAIVARDLLDTIEWVMPDLARIYLSGDEIGKWAPVGPNDEAQADIETQVCNWVLMDRNDGFTQCCATMRDALLLRNGYILGWWRTATSKDEQKYIGLAAEELALILQDKCVKIIEREERADDYGQPCYDVTVEREKEDEWVQIESVPPDEIRVGRRHRMGSLEDADFVQWRHETTVGDLRALGFEVKDNAPDAPDVPLESTYRHRFDESMYPSDQTRDPSRRIVVCKHNWIRLDLDGTGKQQLWRISYIDGTRDVLLKEKADIIPVAAFIAIAYPHSHVGTSYHDLLADLVAVKQALMRQLLDNVYVGNNQRIAVDATRVNIDDLLVSRPGGIIRVDGSMDGALVPVVTQDLSSGILEGINYIDTTKDVRTGVNRASVGLDPNVLNRTATGTQALQSAGRARVEMVARTLAGGYTDLFRIIHSLISKHSTKPIQLEINGEWQAIDPRAWAKRTHFRVSVGMGTGTPEVQMAKLQSIAQFMAQGAQMGLAGPQEFYNWGEEYLKAAGYRNVNKFLSEPKKDAQGNLIPPPQPANPLLQAEQAKQQGQAQLKQMELQADGQKHQAETQVAMQTLQAEHAFELEKLREQLASNERIAAMNNAAKTDLELAKMAEERALQLHVQDREDGRATQQLTAQQQIEGQKLNVEQQKVASTHELKGREMDGKAQTEAQRMKHERALAGAKEPQPEKPAGPDPLVEQVTQLVKHMAKPRKVVRDINGRIESVQ